MKRNDRARRWVLIVAVGALLAGGVVGMLRSEEPGMMNRPAPELAGIVKWINGDATTLEEQRDKVVVLHFWTFSCINCQHNLPFYNRWFDEFAKADLRIVGVHTPETVGEADLAAVTARVVELGIKYPVAADNERATWNAYGNRYWPSIYLIDKKGRIRFRWDGELAYQGAHGDAQVRAKIRELLAE